MTYRAAIVSAATAHGLDPDLVQAVVEQESSGRFYAYRYEPAFGGVVSYDRRKQALDRFDVVAVGDWTWDYRPGQPKETLGVALELWPGTFASPAYDRHFPGVSMSNYGYKQERE